MAAKKQRGSTNNKLVFITVLVVSMFLSVILVMNRTGWLNKAAAPSSRGLINLNSASEIGLTINPDGTMGPETWYGNWSNTLPESSKGRLEFAVTDPPQNGKPENPGSKGKRPTESVVKPSEVFVQPSSPSGVKNGPQEITALNLTISKVEVHLAYLQSAKDQKENPTTTPSEKEKNDHWETLNIAAPFTVDLIQLAQTKDFSTLGITTLAAGKYTEVRLYIQSATATLGDGSVVDLEIPGRNNIIRVIRPFTILAGKETKLTMDIDARRSVVKSGEVYRLKPVVSRLIQEKQIPSVTP